MKKWLMRALVGATCLIIPCPVDALCFSCNINPCCQPIFKGFYIGGNGGFVNYSAERKDDRILATPEKLHSTDTSWTAGVQVGYDWLTCHDDIVLGLVVDWNWSHAEARPRLFPHEGTFNTELRWFSTFRARLGYAHTPCLLLYFTSGPALADIRSALISENSQFTFTHKHQWGGTLGLGTEFAIWRRVTLNAEILYLRFAGRKERFQDVQTGSSIRIRFYDETWVGRLSLNYRFCL